MRLPRICRPMPRLRAHPRWGDQVRSRKPPGDETRLVRLSADSRRIHPTVRQSPRVIFPMALYAWSSRKYRTILMSFVVVLVFQMGLNLPAAPCQQQAQGERVIRAEPLLPAGLEDRPGAGRWSPPAWPNPTRGHGRWGRQLHAGAGFLDGRLRHETRQRRRATPVASGVGHVCCPKEMVVPTFQPPVANWRSIRSRTAFLARSCASYSQIRRARRRYVVGSTHGCALAV
jgi:hypothetical protein